MATRNLRRIFKPLVFVACLGPLAYIVALLFLNQLGANPIEAINRFLGDWALRFILLTLAIRPVAEIGGVRQLIAYRRMIGLYAFFYVVLHFNSYLIIDLQLDWAAFVKDVLKRQFITVGITAVVLLIPLAATSTRGMIRRLGGVAWRRLHSLIYVISMLGVFHFFQMTKADFREPGAYALILAFLLGYRAWGRWKKNKAKRPAAGAA